MPFSFTKQFSLLVKSRLKSLLRQLMIVIPLKSNHQGYHLILPSNTPLPQTLTPTHTHIHTHNLWIGVMIHTLVICGFQ